MKITKAGYSLGVIAASLVLLWIGALKFTAGEAGAIKLYVSNSFIMSWLYKIGSIQQVSDFIGVFEIFTGSLLLASFWNAKAGRIGGYLAVIIFATTTTFLFTTPGIWKTMEGVPVTDFFVLKDLAYLAVGLQVIGNSSDKILA